MAVFFKFNAHCPYRGTYWGRYGEKPSPHLVWLLNMAVITDVNFPEAALTDYRYEYEYAWGKTALRTSLDGMSIGHFGFNKRSAAQVRKIFDNLTKKSKNVPHSSLAFAGPLPGGGSNIFLEQIDSRKKVKNAEAETEARPYKLSSIPAIERWLHNEGHTIIDFSTLQRYNGPGAPKPA